jgi:hypothetical protein
MEFLPDMDFPVEKAPECGDIFRAPALSIGGSTRDL